MGKKVKVHRDDMTCLPVLSPFYLERKETYLVPLIYEAHRVFRRKTSKRLNNRTVCIIENGVRDKRDLVFDEGSLFQLKIVEDRLT